MSTLVSSPFPIFTDIDGQPLEAGYVWLGTVNLDPQVNPINVYWDASLTIVAVQPIRTLGGYPANNGTPARVYVDSDYSIRVMNKNGSVVYSAPASTGRISASMVSYLPAGTGAVATTVQGKLNERMSVLGFFANGISGVAVDPTGVVDSTLGIQAAIDAAQASNRIVHIPTGNYLVTNTLTVYNKTQIIGDTKFQYGEGFGRPTGASAIFFTPASSKTLFNYVWNTAESADPGFTFHTSIQGLFCKCTNANGLYGLALNRVIYANYQDLHFQGFSSGIYCLGTINNRMQNIYCQGTAVAVLYAGNSETTDVWEQCSFWGSPVGVRSLGSTVGLRFNNCLWEQITNYGMDMSSRSQATVVFNAYCEDVPFGAAPAATDSMFRIGWQTGDSNTNIHTQLIISGGQFNGRNAGLAGTFLNVNYCWGIVAGGFSVNRWANIITTTANTNLKSITLGGYQGISWTTNIDDLTKVCGIFPNGVLNTGSYNQEARLGSINTSASVTAGSGAAGGGFTLAQTSAFWRGGGGSPEGALTGPVGSLWSRSDGGTGLSLYLKTSGTGNTGWVPIVVNTGTDGTVLIGTVTKGNNGILGVVGRRSLSQSNTASDMVTEGVQKVVAITTAKVIFATLSQGLSSAASCILNIFGSNNAGATFLDRVVLVSNATTLVVISSTTLAGAPAARTYTVGSDELSLAMASGTYSTNTICSTIGHPF